MKQKTIIGRKRSGRSEFVDDANEFINWLKRHNVNITGSSRYMHYLRIMRNPTSFRLPAKFKDTKYTRSRLYYCAQHELYIASRLHKAYKETENDALIAHFQKTVNGPIFTIKEISQNGTRNTSARDYLFELYTGAIFLKEGAKVEFGDDRFPEPKISIDGCDAAIQCKRVKGRPDTALEKNIKKAQKQLLDNFDDFDSIRYGIIAINLDKLINPLGLVLGSQTGNPRTLVSKQSIAYYQLHKLVKNIQDIALNLDKKIDGILVNFSYVYMDTRDESTGFANHTVYVPRNTNFSVFSKLFPNFS